MHRISKVIFPALFLTLSSYGVISQAQQAPNSDTDVIKISSKASLAHLGSLDSFNMTESGKEAAKKLLGYLDYKDPEALQRALITYERIIPIENFGGEYTTLQWFGEYLQASPEQQRQLLADRYVRNFFEYMSANDFGPLKEYLRRKYKLEDYQRTEETQKREAFLENLILFENPKREQWEKTSKIVDSLNLKPGRTVADIGSGPGYYTFKFAERVGDQGHVFAIDTDKKLLEYVQGVKDKYKIGNVDLIQPTGGAIDLPKESVDMAFMCSLYHVIYLTSKEPVKDAFVNSIKNSLKPDGSLVIVDNALVEAPDLPYHGPYIAKELLIAQMNHYGFRLVDQYAFIPQRYVLVFKKV